MKKAVFFDRDGVINADYAYVGKIENFDFIKGVPQTLKKLKDKGYFLVLVTNQSGVARGMFTEADVLRVTAFMQESLRVYDACFDAVYYCPHHPQASVESYRMQCRCRKPNPGMLNQAAADHDIDMSDSVMIGDHASDLQAGLAAGVGRLILVGSHVESESQKVRCDSVYSDLSEAAEHL